MRRTPGRTRRILRRVSMGVFLFMSLPMLFPRLRWIPYTELDHPSPHTHSAIALSSDHLYLERSVGVLSASLPPGTGTAQHRCTYGPIEYDYHGSASIDGTWSATWWSVTVHLFWPMVVAGILAIMVWWRTRVVREGTCATCSYDLRGLALDATCPECGTRRLAAQPTNDHNARSSSANCWAAAATEDCQLLSSGLNA